MGALNPPKEKKVGHSLKDPLLGYGSAALLITHNGGVITGCQ